MKTGEKMNHILRKTIALSALLMLWAFQAQAEVRSHHHQEETSEKAITLQLDHGKPWGTDASLRQGMERIRKAVSIVHTSSVDGVLSKAEATALSAEIDDSLAFMFEHCRLAPEADTNLHILLERLMHASDSFKERPSSADGMSEVLRVLENYPRYFAHPEWTPVGQLELNTQ